MNAVKRRARDYFFLPKNKDIEVKRDVFKKLHKFVKQEIRPVVDLCEKLTESQIAKLPWNIRRAFDTLKSDAWRYLLDVGHFTRTHTIKAGKLLSFHAKELACINKGKRTKVLLNLKDKGGGHSREILRLRLRTRLWRFRAKA